MHLFDEKPFIVGDLTSPLGSKPIQIIEDGDGGDTVQDGDHVSRWNWVMEWGDGCLKPSELEKVSWSPCAVRCLQGRGRVSPKNELILAVLFLYLSRLVPIASEAG